MNIGPSFSQGISTAREPFPKIRELLEQIKRDGKRIALATSSKKSESKISKKLLHIEDLIDAETSADDAEKSKPCPDIFAAALHALKDPAPNEVIVVEIHRSMWKRLARLA